ncbi:glutamyl-tRNA amidotransferase [candidate division MSBL1 archaeon SCGC-AAA261F17]|uniref:Glutamyl-tRNA(Gln) amidotransferase subunit A n=1 Tax=candidate division MSBL1 archaeon SCGC-AAA261F17 TaxID=1698274 RepID=A0A133V7I5_9EURY|nr:glutamyl-tRNA amidotransferase [candidate division MSBL1 archaeon SCGC-AAA261F17]
MSTREKLEKIRSGELSAVENVRQTLERIEELNDDVNAFIEPNPDAVTEAEAVDKKIEEGEEVGKLAGLAIAVKTNINTKGLRATCASKTLENYVATYDAEAIKRVRSEDGIIIGVNNMDEFACGSSGETSAFGLTKNPAAKGRVPGGSSSGGGASVAAGMCDIALGTDTGGSIRNPASHCGVVGLKPTYGLVPRQGLIDLAMSFDQIGPLSPDVFSAALMMEVIAGKNPNECIMFDVDSVSYLDQLDGSLEGMKIGVSPKFRELTQPEIMKVIDQTVDELSGLGAEVVEVDLPNLEKAMPTYYLIVSVEFFSGTRKFDGRKYGQKIEEVCGDEVLRRILRGKHISRKEFKGKFYQRALQVRTLIKRELDEALKEADVLVGPTVPKLPHKIGTELTPGEMYAYDYFTVPTNLGGLCGGVIKAGEVKGIPVGLQVQGASLDESSVLKVMRALEAGG